MRIAVAGGGTERDSVRIDECFADWVGSRGRLLYIPVALGWQPDEYQNATDWLHSVFSPLGIRMIATWTTLENRDPSELAKFTAIYIGGGNTYSLLYQLRASGFDRAIANFAQEGHPVYGGSAGAAVLGKDINTVARLDPNDVQLDDTSGLNLLSGSSVWVHYKLDEKESVEQYARNSGQALIVVSERSGVAFENGRPRTMGFEDAYIVDSVGWTTVETWSRSIL